MKSEVIRIKFCGMRDTTNILDIAALKPDYMGFIFYEKSPRFVGKDFTIPREFPGSVSKVGVFVDEHAEKVRSTCEKHDIGIVQLHGNEDPEYCERASASGLSVIKVFQIDDSFDFNITHVYDPFVDFFLFDTKGPKPGGNAMSFNWKSLLSYRSNKPFFLSGGIMMDNIRSAPRSASLFALDINSGAESAPGMKSIDKAGEIVRTLKEINQNL